MAIRIVTRSLAGGEQPDMIIFTQNPTRVIFNQSIQTMKQVFYVFAFLFSSVISFADCSLTIDYKQYKGKQFSEISLSVPQVWFIGNPEQLKKPVSKNGKTVFHFKKLPSSIFYLRTDSFDMRTIWLENGDSLIVVLLSFDNQTRVQMEYKGKGAAKNKYLDLFNKNYKHNGGFDEQYKLFAKTLPKEFTAQMKAETIKRNKELDSVIQADHIKSLNFKKYMLDMIRYDAAMKYVDYPQQYYYLNKIDSPEYLLLGHDYYAMVDSVPLNNDKMLHDFSYHFFIEGTVRDWDNHFYYSNPKTYTYKNSMDYLLNKVIEKFQKEPLDIALSFLMYDYINRAVSKEENMEILKDKIQEYKKYFSLEKYAQAIDSIFVLKCLLKTGVQIADYCLPDSNNTKYCLRDLKDKYIVIDFWGTWCIPCLKQLPYYENLKETFKKDSSLVFISVACENAALKKWKSFLSTHKMSGLQVYAEGQSDNPILKNLQITSFPTFVLLNKDNRLYKSRTASPSGNLEQQIREMMKEK